MDKKKIARQLIRMARKLTSKSVTALQANMQNLYKALSRVVDVKFSNDRIYSSELGLAEFNKVRKVMAQRLKWLGFEMVDKWPGGQRWRNEEFGGDEIVIYSSKMLRGWAFSVEPASVTARTKTASLQSALDEIKDLYDDVYEALDWRTLSSEEAKEFDMDLGRAFGKTKELSSWGKVFKSAMEEIGEVADELEQYEVKESTLRSDLKLLQEVLDKHGIADRILHPRKYINKERDFMYRNKAYLPVIPKWLKPILVENEIDIYEGFEGFYFQGENQLSPEFEELVDLIGWAKSNKSKLK